MPPPIRNFHKNSLFRYSQEKNVTKNVFYYGVKKITDIREKLQARGGAYIYAAFKRDIERPKNDPS